MAYKHSNVFWDWDGTIVDSMAVYGTAFQQTHAAYNLPYWSLEQFAHNANTTTPKHFARFVTPEKLDEVIAHCYKIIHATDIPIFPEARGWFEGVVERGGKNIIISNKRHAALLHDIERFGVGHLITAAVGGDELANHKPHPDHMYLAAQRAGVTVSPDDAMVGDSPSDYHIAKDTGTYAYLLHSQVHDFAELTKDYPKTIIVERPLLHKTLFQG